MDAISLTPGAALRLRDLAKPLATKAAQFLTSTGRTATLGTAATAAVLWFNLDGSHPLRTAALVMAWALQFAATLTIDIRQKGGEL